MNDLREYIFSDIKSKEFVGIILPECKGILSGIYRAAKAAEELGLEIMHLSSEGEQTKLGRPVMMLRGDAMQLAMAEDRIIGLLSKPSGIATAARTFTDAANGKFDIVCGSWKKVDAAVKEPYRKAIETGGCRCRMLNEPMVYIDKNYVIMLGGVDKAIQKVKRTPELAGRKIVVQVKGKIDPLGEECWMAADSEADYIYLDTGNISDIPVLLDALDYAVSRPKIVFGGNVTLETLPELFEYPIDIVGVGRAIIDAPMLDMKMDIIPPKVVHKCHKH